jgi:hypothetical protein
MRKVGRVQDGERHEMKAVLWTIILNSDLYRKEKGDRIGRQKNIRPAVKSTKVLRVKIEEPARTG